MVDLNGGLSAGHFSSEELTRHFLERIGRFNRSYNAFITVAGEQALQQARRADAERANGRAGPLCGLPLAHKDLFCTRGLPTTCASRMLEHFVPPYDAAVVERLAAAGAVVVGKTNMDEFAMGSSNETSHLGPVRNPWDVSTVSGGSSGGSAAAVAARLVPVATGTDTGGSIRQPAALCGITGLKPSYGRVSRYGMVAFASSLDQAGPMTRSAEDAALLLGSMAGFDERDSTSVDRPVEDYLAALRDSPRGLRVGLVQNWLPEHAGANAVREAVPVLEKLGCKIREIVLPRSDLGLPAYYVIASAECSSNLARYDGVRYGYRCTAPRDLEDMFIRSRSEGFGAEVQRRILIGTYVLSAGYRDAYYRKAQQLRRLIQQEFAAAFADVDILLGATAAGPAFPLGAKSDDPVRMYMEDLFTVPASLAGLPGLSLPCGFAENLPLGMHLVAPHFQEGRLLSLAHHFQCETDWHQRVPPDLES